MNKTENYMEVVKSGLIQYIGAIMTNIEGEKAEAAHIASAKLSEAWLECCKKNDKEYNMFAAKPLLRACYIILDNYYANILKDLPGDTPSGIKERLGRIKTSSQTIKELVESIKGADYESNSKS